MKNIENMNTQYCVVLADSASSLTQGGHGVFLEQALGEFYP